MTDRDAARVATVQREFARWAERIRADTTLTAEGKRLALAKAWAPAKKALAALAEAEVNGARDQLRAVERRVFGVPSYASADKVLAWRDACARADNLPDAAALRRELQRARRRGDELLEKAVLGAALERGVRDVVADAAARDSGLAQSLGEMQELSAVDSREARFERSMGYALAPPPEIAGLGPLGIERLANGDAQAEPETAA